MQKKKYTKRKCLNLDSSCEYESLNNLNNPYGYDYCYSARSLEIDNFKKMHHITNYDYLEKK